MEQPALVSLCMMNVTIPTPQGTEVHPKSLPLCPQNREYIYTHIHK